MSGVGRPVARVSGCLAGRQHQLLQLPAEATPRKGAIGGSPPAVVIHKGPPRHPHNRLILAGLRGPLRSWGPREAPVGSLSSLRVVSTGTARNLWATRSPGSRGSFWAKLSLFSPRRADEHDAEFVNGSLSRMIHRRDTQDAEEEPVTCRAGCAGPEDGKDSPRRTAEKREGFRVQGSRVGARRFAEPRTPSDEAVSRRPLRSDRNSFI